jgi:hypothetical protein
VPPCAVEHERDVLLRAGADGFGEVVERDLEQVGVDARQQQPLDPAAGRVNEAVDVQPLVATPTDGEGSLALLGPDAAEDGDQAEPCFVWRLQLELGARVVAPDHREAAPKFFLKRSCSSAVAALWRGRGVCLLRCSRCK